MKTKILVIIAALIMVSGAHAQQGSNECLQGARAAYEAYLLTTIDAQYPDMHQLVFMLQYRISQQPFPVDASAAARALIFITNKQRDAGDRRVYEMHVMASTQSFIERECVYHGS